MEPTKQDLSADPNAAPPPYAASSQAAPYPYQQPQQGMYHVGAPPQYPPTSYPQAGAGQPYPQVGYPTTTSYGQTTQTTVVMAQPGGYAPVTNVMAAPPNHMALSILTCLFCFWPLGLAAIIKSNEVDNAVRRGDIIAASTASQSARRLSMLSIGFGIGAYILVVVIVIIQVAVVSSQTSYRY